MTYTESDIKDALNLLEEYDRETFAGGEPVYPELAANIVRTWQAEMAADKEKV